MAHPTVEKLKEVGLLYGDKAAVALTSLIFVVCLGVALSKKSIDLKPDDVKTAAETADANINRRQPAEDIIKVLEAADIKPTNFSREVADAAKTVLLADNYKSDREWVIPEPGAGLIRDTPSLIAPSDLYAYPGRGGALVYDLDENGEKKPETEKKDATKEETRGRRRRRSGGMGGMGGMMGGMAQRRGAKGVRKSQADLEKEQQKEVEEKKKEIASKLAGRDETPAPEDRAKEEKEKQAAPQQQYKEITRGLRWVAITGTIDHAKLVANFKEALKSPTAHPYYARLDLERQTREKDGSWAAWEAVDAKENLKILDNLPEEDEELTAENVRPPNLNDPLPFLKAGLWEKVHIASLVPKEKKEVAPPPAMGGMGGMGGMRGMGGSMGGSMSMMGGGSSAQMSAMMGGMGQGAGNYSRMMGSGRGMQGTMRGMGGRGGEGDMMGSMGGGGASEVDSSWKSDEKRIMIRALDFTPKPDTAYRYRVRIVVFNPNHNRDDVSPSVDKKATELMGPWSEPTDEVDMPADVSAYAMGVMPMNPKSDLKVNFEVVRFDLADGVTIPHRYAASPGEVIGEISSADIPTSEGTGKKTKPVDFNTRQIVLDTVGGLQPPPAGFSGGGIERPAMALVLRPDGSVLARAQPDDQNDEVRKDIERNYAREIKDSGKKRENSMGSGYGGMMGGMMGYGMGGMGGMGGMR